MYLSWPRILKNVQKLSEKKKHMDLATKNNVEHDGDIGNLKIRGGYIF